MRNILRALNEETSIDGSMVITPDGIMVAAALSPDLEEDAVAAFASSILLSMTRGMSMLGSHRRLIACSLRGSERNVTFFNMDNSFLVVVASPHLDLDACDDAIQDAIHQIKHRRVA